MTAWAPGTRGTRRRKQSIATEASAPGFSTRSMSRITRVPWFVPRAATITNFVPLPPHHRIRDAGRRQAHGEARMISPVRLSTRMSPGLARNSRETTLPSACRPDRDWMRPRRLGAVPAIRSRALVEHRLDANNREQDLNAAPCTCGLGRSRDERGDDGREKGSEDEQAGL